MHFLPYRTTSVLKRPWTLRTRWTHSLLTHPLWSHAVTTAWLGKAILSWLPSHGYHARILCDTESLFSFSMHRHLPQFLNSTSTYYSQLSKFLLVLFSWVHIYPLNPSILSSNLYQVTLGKSLFLFPLLSHFHLEIKKNNPKYGW